MSSAVSHIHPILADLRDAVAGDETLTHPALAEQLGVSLRTVVAWMNTDTTPQKRHMHRIASWLESRPAIHDDGPPAQS